MEVNETNRPLTEVQENNVPETSVPTVESVESTDKPVYAPKQTQEEVVERLTEINKDACNADKLLSEKETSS